MKYGRGSVVLKAALRNVTTVRSGDNVGRGLTITLSRGRDGMFSRLARRLQRAVRPSSHPEPADVVPLGMRTN